MSHDVHNFFFKSIDVQLLFSMYMHVKWHVMYFLRPKMIVLSPEFICPKMITQFICPARNFKLKVNYFHVTLYYCIFRFFWHRNFQGRFIVVVYFIFRESYLQLLGQWSTGFSFANVRNMDKHFETERVQLLCEKQDNVVVHCEKQPWSIIIKIPWQFQCFIQPLWDLLKCILCTKTMSLLGKHEDMV